MAVLCRAIQSSVLELTEERSVLVTYSFLPPHVNPFLPSAISTVSVLFFSTGQCIFVTGDVSDTKSVPPNVRMSAAVPL
ncbi:unnamed protein product [Staurois parvus]|uniref:Uncharacterized protein n=1 Tax=Staurois parvus TaxID=386267 RepID=A0ABN9DCJ2_9NEOB|nr:unnamed protein product [Staurois parvus]